MIHSLASLNPCLPAGRFDFMHYNCSIVALTVEAKKPDPRVL